MFDTLKDFLRSIAPIDDARPAGDDPVIAAAALLHHVCEADGTVSAQERIRLQSLLVEAYGIEPARAMEVAAAGREADLDAVDLFRFTQVLMQHLSEAERIRFVELLWEVVFVDGTVHELEDNVVWRISELLGVSARDRMLGKREAAARRQGRDV